MSTLKSTGTKTTAACRAAIIAAFCAKRSFVRRKISKFAYMNSDWTTATQWCENIIIADADHVDRVAFDLIVNFERMLMRRIPQADMARWLDCVALDGGVREGEEQTQVVLIHDKAHGRMDNFKPSVYDTELDGKAFKDNLGEFAISSLAVESMVSKDDLVCERRQAHHRIRHAAHAGRQFPSGNTGLLAHERPRHTRGRTEGISPTHPPHGEGRKLV